MSNDVTSVGSWLSAYIWKPVSEAAEEVAQAAIEVAKFAVGHEDSLDLPIIAPPLIACSSDISPGPNMDVGLDIGPEFWDQWGENTEKDAKDAETASLDIPPVAPDTQEEKEPETHPDLPLKETEAGEDSFDSSIPPETTGPETEEPDTVCIPEEEIPYDYTAQDCYMDLADVDHDGFCLKGYQIQNKEEQCPNENGAKGTDCKDDNELINPAQPELCNLVDDNCSWSTDENSVCYTLYYCDSDKDSFVTEEPTASCNFFGCIPEGCGTVAGSDCNDNNYPIHPGAPELCNKTDDNCNGETDEGCEPKCIDKDQDGYGQNCPGGPDCEDNETAINPGAPELCDETDNNCNNLTDEGCEPECIDNDSDGYGVNCYLGPDCDDTDLNIHPKGKETCNNKDDNCDGLIDNGIPDVETYGGSDWQKYVGICQPAISACQEGVWQEIQPEILPQEEEPCNGEDEDCDFFFAQGTDNDKDGSKTNGGFCGPIDCNDNNPFVNPDLIEICDAIDNNCDNNIDEGCSDPFYPSPASFNPIFGMLRGVFDGGLPGDSGRTKLGNFDNLTGRFHYFSKFYWNLDTGEKVKNGQPVSIEAFSNQVWESGRMPLMVIKVDNFTNDPHGITSQAVDALREFTYWLVNEYNGEIAVSLYPEMNLTPSEYCEGFSSLECMEKFEAAFKFTSNMLQRAADGKAHVGLNYNMRFNDNTFGSHYTDWDVGGEYYNWVGYNVFVHTCVWGGEKETEDEWFLFAALTEPGNDFHDTFCLDEKPCVIAETAASDSCSPGYQNWWMGRFTTGDYPDSPYINIYMPGIKGYVWFNHNNEPLGGWEENWQVQDLAAYKFTFTPPYYKDKP